MKVEAVMLEKEDIESIKRENREWSNFSPAERSQMTADFLDANPKMLLMFMFACRKRITDAEASGGKIRKLSPNTIISNDLRGGKLGNRPFKINNNLISRLARLAISIEGAAFDNFLRMRDQPIKSNPNNRYTENDHSEFLGMVMKKDGIMKAIRVWRKNYAPVGRS